MEDLKIKGEKFIPDIDFNSKKGEFNISGRSYHENTNEFFEPVLSWLKQYVNEYDQDTTLNFKLTYFNTPSSKAFAQILKILENYKGKIVVNWFYQIEDEDMMEDGQNLRDITSVEVKLVSY